MAGSDSGMQSAEKLMERIRELEAETAALRQSVADYEQKNQFFEMLIRSLPGIFARAMAMRCRCPPLISCGYRWKKYGSIPTLANKSSTRSFICSRGTILCSLSGSATIWPICMRGLNDA